MINFCVTYAASDVAVFFCDSVPEDYTVYCSINGMCCAVKDGALPIDYDDRGTCDHVFVDYVPCTGS